LTRYNIGNKTSTSKTVGGITVVVNQIHLDKTSGVFKTKTIDNFEPLLLTKHSNFYTNMGAVTE